MSRSFKRHIAGRIFATLSSWMTGLAIYDSQCGCKIVRRSCYERVHSLLAETRFAFDIELLTHLHGARATMREILWTGATSLAVRSLFSKMECKC